METTIRQQIIDLLKGRTCDARSISHTLGISQREVETHLNHVAQSAKAQGLHLIIEASKCTDCGFKFSNRERTSKPGKCPKCREGQITPPLFSIE